ncbi:hypothetical protein PR001_g1128 [Phytophthora rubi]|uniref:Uncharacterized protein n=1 Tax=Phytophthora rubi TaxID=129364 RepID=A0A6A3P440_9STRA|nr:hypothetical protein PR001_g1128 [Phytophthora rubi]
MVVRVTVVTSLLSSATPNQQRQVIQEFMERELAKANRRVPTLSHSSRNDAVKSETSVYSSVGQDRLPPSRWFREVKIAIANDRSADGESQLPVVSSVRKSQEMGPW